MKNLTHAFIFMLTVTLCALFHLNAYSQPPAGGQGQRPQMTIDQRIEQLDKAVTLTPDQKKKIRAIWEENQKTRAQSPPQSSGERPNSRREQLNQSQQQQRGSGARLGGLNPEIQKILTPAQLKKYQASMSQSNIDRQIDRLSSLKLSEDQKKKLRTILENQNEKNQKAIEKIRDSQDQQARMDAVRKMREDNDKEIVKVLTPAQAKQYTEMQQQMMNNRGQGRGGRGRQN